MGLYHVGTDRLGGRTLVSDADGVLGDDDSIGLVGLTTDASRGDCVATVEWVRGLVAGDAGVDLSVYLTRSDAVGTYLSLSDAAATYLPRGEADSLYLTQADAATRYLAQDDADILYLRTTNAAQTYATITALTSQISALDSTLRAAWASDLDSVAASLRAHIRESALVGPQGERGERGLRGPAGADGADGARGADGRGLSVTPLPMNVFVGGSSPSVQSALHVPVSDLHGSTFLAVVPNTSLTFSDRVVAGSRFVLKVFSEGLSLSQSGSGNVRYLGSEDLAFHAGMIVEGEGQADGSVLIRHVGSMFSEGRIDVVVEGSVSGNDLSFPYVAAVGRILGDTSWRDKYDFEVLGAGIRLTSALTFGSNTYPLGSRWRIEYGLVDSFFPVFSGRLLSFSRRRCFNLSKPTTPFSDSPK